MKLIPSLMAAASLALKMKDKSTLDMDPMTIVSQLLNQIMSTSGAAAEAAAAGSSDDSVFSGSAAQREIPDDTSSVSTSTGSSAGEGTAPGQLNDRVAEEAVLKANAKAQIDLASSLNSTASSTSELSQEVNSLREAAAKVSQVVEKNSPVPEAGKEGKHSAGEIRLVIKYPTPESEGKSTVNEKDIEEAAILQQFGNDEVELAKRDLKAVHVPLLYIKSNPPIDGEEIQQTLDRLNEELRRNPGSSVSRRYQASSSVADSEDLRKRYVELLDEAESRSAFFAEDGAQTEALLKRRGANVESLLAGVKLDLGRAKAEKDVEVGVLEAESDSRKAKTLSELAAASSSSASSSSSSSSSSPTAAY